MAASVVAAARASRSTIFTLRPRINDSYYSPRWVARFATSAESATEEPRSVPVNAVKNLLESGHCYVDVRTGDEFIAGHPKGAINIPYMFKSGAGMDKNPKFAEEVSSSFAKDDSFLVGCQSGRRSLMAAHDLHSAGFRYVINVAGGYSAWLQHGLPTEAADTVASNKL
ncbi:hypothetical protein SAY86_004916 [Trapa natans]|uniref:Rhodanese domain-containing protein n=1 Tax=Trapa natans TaxID=22666 RepID=A0AAN7RFX1_TRANT|nr:hypothetical protein SAY86_004916 [Trapa natans]